MGALTQTFIAVGIFWAYLFQLILKSVDFQDYHWRLIYGFSFITILIQTILLIFVYN
jgi:hypothetical protein